MLTNFELKLEIPNIMLVCKFEINWSTNKNVRADGQMDGRPAFSYPRSALWGRGAIKSYPQMVASCNRSKSTNFVILLRNNIRAIIHKKKGPGWLNQLGCWN